MKKILYIANSRIPTERAHGIQIMKMCEAFTRAGYVVELIIPNISNHIKEDPFLYHDVEKIFTIHKVHSVDLVHLGKAGFLIQSFTFALAVALYTRKKHADVIYSRDENSLFVLSFFTRYFYMEVHDNRSNFVIRHAVRAASGVISITKRLTQFYVDKGFSPEKFFVAADGVDLKDFGTIISKESARKKLNIPLDKKIVVYTGHLYAWKGVDVLAQTIKKLSNDTLIYFVGGIEEDISVLMEEYQENERIISSEHRPHNEIPLWQKAADVLVLPNVARYDISKLYTSPIKLFEYMASGRPIVASRIPSIEEILNDTNATLIQPDSVDDLARGIKEALAGGKDIERRRKQALQDVKVYSWNKRATNILNFINKKNHESRTK